MSYKTLLAILQAEDDAARVLDFAVPMAARHDAHLIGVHAEALPIAFAATLGGPPIDFATVSGEVTESRVREMRALFNDRTERGAISREWRGMESVSGDAALSALESARSADLVIAQQTDPDAPSQATANVEALLFEGGRPVLFIPYAGAVADPAFRKIMLAWNGSREAARAAFDALPLMREAEAVEILCVDAEDGESQDAGMAGAEIAATLARHGIETTAKSVDSAGVPHGAVIENEAARSSADLLVMGAYGQSRLKEFIFGGATSSILKSMPIPVLMSR